VVRFAVLLASLAAFTACSPNADNAEAPPASVARPSNPFFGTWTTATAQVAPWWDQQGAPPEMNPDFQNTPLVFAAGRSSGPKIVTCAKPVYTVNVIRAQALFEGNLPNPQTDATALGFSGPDISTLNLSCTEGAANVSLDFAMADETTILLALDNMIYTLKRQ
jgi:hypothetical protein